MYPLDVNYLTTCLELQKTAPISPTAGVSRKWAGRGLGWGAGKTQSHEKGLKNAPSPTCRLHAVLGSFSHLNGHHLS